MIMRSSRVREETPQPTIRVTDGSSALSMICRGKTRPNMSLRADYKHAKKIIQRGKPVIGVTHTHTHHKE